jgi:hypothetical protein
VAQAIRPRAACWHGVAASGRASRPPFPPSVVVQVKALACELSHRLLLPLSRLSLSEIRREGITLGLVAEHYFGLLFRVNGSLRTHPCGAANERETVITMWIGHVVANIVI